ncbi:TPA: hypothetical protein H1011_01360 [archaeon]|jgi:hypothetical protein|uniref:Uncharacterized protein n=1 Tax=Candidatus Undinarchaeum marinum TaxID=2756141 RepID=A0A832UTG3_9ARCH|nr:hypothetical protein [Candidatus Undinarchaeum marinum]
MAKKSTAKKGKKNGKGKLTMKHRELIEDAGWFNAGIIIEVQGNNKEHVSSTLEALVERLGKEEDVKIYSTDYDEMQEFKDGFFSLMVDTRFITKDFGRLVHIALLYSPSVFEIYSDKKDVGIAIGDAQNILVDVSNLVNRLAHQVFILKGHINRLESGEKNGKSA